MLTKTTDGSDISEQNQANKRSCGVLLHISSLPSKYYIGSLGPEAHAFAETLAASKIKYWQVLPLTPTSTFIGNSPYSSPSAFAGNPLFISLEILQKDNLLSAQELSSSSLLLPNAHPCHRPDRVDYTEATNQHNYMLELAFQRQEANLGSDPDFKAFVKNNADWLLDYALFTAIKTDQNGACWTDWPEALKWRKRKALTDWQDKHQRAVLKQQFIQYLFFSQWQALRNRCKRLGLELIGDLPIYVTHDSADVWANPDLFQMDDNGAPQVVAGVPPDYFSATGQRWGNPVYDWDKMQREGFAWWIKRMKHNLKLVDVIRLDHFRGFCAYWAISADEKTAINGKWVKAPARDLLLTLKKHFADLPFIAEDLGVITPDVREIMQEFELPGMKILQFAFGGEAGEGLYLPFRHPVNSVVYTGTHDNPTSKQWFTEANEHEKNNFICYRGQNLDPDYANEVLMRMALESQARLAILPMQDILRLDASGRMNTPSVSQGNWEWRVSGMAGWLPAEYWSDAEQLQKDQNTEQKATQNNAQDSTPTAAPVPDVFKHIHFLCSQYGRL